MAMTQNERTKKYNQKFTRTDLRIKKEDFDLYKNHLLKKGYSSFNDYINTTVKADLLNGNVIPNKTDLGTSDNL